MYISYLFSKLFIWEGLTESPRPPPQKLWKHPLLFLLLFPLSLFGTPDQQSCSGAQAPLVLIVSSEETYTCFHYFQPFKAPCTQPTCDHDELRLMSFNMIIDHDELGHLPLKSPAWTGLLPKGDQVLGDVHLEDVLPAPPRETGWQGASVSVGEILQT